MNAKEKNIINTLKIVSAEQDKLSRAAQKIINIWQRFTH